MSDASKDERPPASSHRIREVSIGIALGVLSAAFVLFSQGTESGFTLPGEGAYAATDPAYRDHPLHGEWEQFLWHSEEEGWISGGFYRVAGAPRALRMSVLDSQANADDVLRSRGLNHVSFDGETWVFDSQLENGEMLTFRLRQTERDVFEGYAFYDDTRGSPNRWVRSR